MPARQVSVATLLQKAIGMFPEGQGAPKTFAKDDSAAEKTNELLYNVREASNGHRACVRPVRRLGSRPLSCRGSGRERSLRRGAGAPPRPPTGRVMRVPSGSLRRCAGAARARTRASRAHPALRRPLTSA